MSQTLRIGSGTDMVISDTVVDSSGNSVTTGQTVVHNIQRLSDGMWWGGSSFDEVSEPAGTSAAQVGTTGVYEQTLSSAFDGVSLEYKVRHQLTGTIAIDFYDTDNIETGANVIKIANVKASILIFYPDGFIYYDAGATTNTGTVLGTDGRADNPVTDEDSATTISNNTGLPIKVKGNFITANISGRVMVAGDSTATLTGVDPNGSAPNWSDCIIKGMRVTGFGRMNNNTEFHDCVIADIRGQFDDGFQGKTWNCIWEGNIDLEPGATAETVINGGKAAIISPTFDFQQATNQHNLSISKLSGSVDIVNMTNAGAILDVSSDGDTEIEIEASCTLGTATLKGLGNLTDNSSLSPDLTNWEELPIPIDISAIDGDTSAATRLKQIMGASINGLVSATPVGATTLVVKTLTNDANADLNRADVLKDRVLTFTSGLLQGHSVGITASTAAAAEPYTLTTTTMINFANIAVNDEFVIT